VKRREFISLLGGAAAILPHAARAQQGAVPVIGFVYPGTPELSTGVVAAFRKGLGETGFVEGRNVGVEFRFAYNDNTRVAELIADLVGRRVAVIVTPGSTSTALAAKAATMSIPVVFSVGTDPVEIGLVTSLSRPGGNVTGITSLNSELAAKRLGLMLELLPSAVRFATLVNPNNRNTDSLTRDAQAAASAIGRQVEILAAGTPREIDAAFVSLVQKRADALLVSPDPLLDTRRVQLVTLAAHQRLPAIYSFRENVEIGGGGPRPPGRSLCRPHPQGGGARQPAGDARRQVRVRAQSADRTGTQPRRSGNAAGAGRRGDRVGEMDCCGA
jgi:putative tryptophan/tyrosine transport system substrate-binding protein